MADRGMGIRLFNNKQDLQEILESFENGNEDEQSDVEGVGDETAVMISQLRHFVVQVKISILNGSQSYVLLYCRSIFQTPFYWILVKFKSAGCKRQRNQKNYMDIRSTHFVFSFRSTCSSPFSQFHLRAYCVSAGAIQLYLCNHILALFSGVPYATPVAKRTLDGQPVQVDLKPHLTNTSLQPNHSENTVRLLDELVGCHILSGVGNKKLLPEDVVEIVRQMTFILAETFKAALQNPVHFQVSLLYLLHLQKIDCSESLSQMHLNCTGSTFSSATRQSNHRGLPHFMLRY